MIRTLLLGAFLGVAPEVVRRVVGKRRQPQGSRPRHYRPQGYPTAGFRAGPRWSWCPAERAQTPPPDRRRRPALPVLQNPHTHEVKTRG